MQKIKTAYLIIKSRLITDKNLRYFLIVFAIAAFWRVINYSDRLALEQDQARDSVIAFYSIQEKKLPLLGSPASAGPFSFGPLYFWVIIISTLVFYFTYLGPWIGFTLLSLASVVLYYFLGKKLHGAGFALILGLIAAFASGEVGNATNVLNPSLVGFAAILLIYFVGKYIVEKRLVYALLCGLSLGLAINTHFQALGLLTLLPLSLVLVKEKVKRRIYAGLLMMSGLLITFIPLIYFDLINKGIWIKSVINYVVGGQNKYFVPVRWLTDITIFWPRTWGEILTKYEIVGYLILPILFLIFIYKLKNKVFLSRTWWVLALSFLLQVVIVRYYKGPRLPLYFVSFYPFVIFFTAWGAYEITRHKRNLGLIIISLLLLISTIGNLKIINFKGNSAKIFPIERELQSKIQGKISLYNYNHNPSNSLTFPLFYLLVREGKINRDGYKVGACINFLREGVNKTQTENCPSEGILIEKNSYRLYDLSGFSAKEIASSGFTQVTSQDLFNILYVNYPTAMDSNPL